MHQDNRYKVRKLFLPTDWMKVIIPDRIVDSKAGRLYEDYGAKLACSIVGHDNMEENGKTFCIWCFKEAK